MGPERIPEPFEGMPVVSSPIPIPRLMPDVGIEGSIGFRAGNTHELMPKIREAFRARPWIHKLAADVRHNRKSAIVVASLGAVTIIVAAAGFEFGVRNGRDLRHFLDRDDEPTE